MYALITIVGYRRDRILHRRILARLRNAIAGIAHGSPESEWVPKNRYGGIVAFSVVASAVVIAAAGFIPAMIYAGPLLAHRYRCRTRHGLLH